MLAELAKAQAHMATVSDEDMNRHQAEYQKGLNQLKATVGAAWHEVLFDLDQCRVLPDPVSYYELSVNYTGHDGQVLQVQALGRHLMRKHGIEPDDEAPEGLSDDAT